MTSNALSARSRALAALCVAVALWCAPAQAQSQEQSGAAAREAELNAAYEAGIKAGTRGPADIKLIDQATLAIPADTIFIPKAEGMRMLRALGNTVSGDTHQGLVLGLKSTDGWIVVVRYLKEGYIKDDEAKDWNADELLQNLKEGTAESNKDRVARGFPEVEIIGWIEKPTYESKSHELVWSLRSKHKGEPDGGVNGVNYNTYALGREGYFSLNLLTDSSRVAGDKAVARTLLGALDYNAGKRYDDFNMSTDRIAAYGIAALIGGVAAKKLGLIAVIGAFLLKFAKVIAIGAAAFFGGIWKFFGRKRSQA